MYIFSMLHVMKFYLYILFLKLFSLGHAETSRTQWHFTFEKYA